MKLSHRLTCRLCDGKNLELVIALEPIPLSERYTDTPEEAKRYPIDLYICRRCGHAQQLDVPENLWEGYTYYSGQAPGMVGHFEMVAKKLIPQLQPNSLVVDVGSNDGSLLKPFKEAGHKVLGIDPAKDIAALATDRGIETIPKLLTVELAQEIRRKHGPASLVCAFNAFAHADDLGEMLEAILCLMDRESIFVFEVQYLLDVIDKMLIGTFFHEHMSHHSLTPMVRFLASHCLELIDVERVSIQHGSIIGTAQIFGSDRHTHESVPAMVRMEEERKLNEPKTLIEFGESIKSLKTEVQSFPWRGMVAGYGAARSAPTLIAQLGLKGVIECIFDDHPQKVGKYSPDGLPILPTAKLLELMPRYCIILAWVHAETIIENNQDYLAKGGSFVVLGPGIRVVSRNAIAAFN